MIIVATIRNRRKFPRSCLVVNELRPMSIQVFLASHGVGTNNSLLAPRSVSNIHFPDVEDSSDGSRHVRKIRWHFEHWDYRIGGILLAYWGLQFNHSSIRNINEVRARPIY